MASSAQQKDTLTKNTGAAKTLPYTFILPNGNRIPAEKIDSVDKAWGGRGLIWSHPKNSDGKTIYLLPKTENYEQKAADAQKLLDAQLNTQAKDFILRDLKGRKYQLAHMLGKVVVLNFYFRSCAPCIAEIPDLNAVEAKFRGKDVIFLALALDSPAEVAAFLKQHRFSFISLPNAGAVHRQFSVSVCPTTIVIDRNGIIRFITRDSRTVADSLPKVVQQHLK